MSRVQMLVGSIVAVGLAVATAGIEPVPVAHGGDTSRRGRLEFRHAAPAVSAVAAAGAAAAAAAAGTTPDTPVGPAPTDPVKPPTAEPGQPATTEPAAAAEPEEVTVGDVELCQVEEAVLPTFSMTAAVRIHIDPEGILYWVSGDKRTELNTQRTVRANLAKYFDRPFVIVPDRWTNWLYVKDTLDSAFSEALKQVYLGTGRKDAPTTLHVLRVYPTRSDDAPADGDFVVGLAEGEGWAPKMTVDGEPLDTFPTDLALQYQDWAGAHGDADASTIGATPIVLEPHKFTPMKQVLPVIGVLQGLGVEAMRLVGDTGYAGRKRR